jgi:hypothetical protein
MKIVLQIAIFCGLVLHTPLAAAQAWGYLPVFPGAQGFGTETPAGRGGKIIKVTNLNDSGTGSLRAAIEASGPRIVVFEVGGAIKASKDLRITNPFITIAGQTAPSPGIHIQGAGLSVRTNNVLVQHLTLRPGDDLNGPNPDDRDAFQILGKPQFDTYNVVLDHISASWAIDETGSTWYPVNDVTISNSILSEGLDKSLHTKGPHSKGMLIGGQGKRISMIGNLLAHNVERMPMIQGNCSVVFNNNVLYNVGISSYASIGQAAGPTLVSMVGNVFINGPNTPSNARALWFRADLVTGSRAYYPDNRFSGTLVLNSASFNPTVTNPPIWHESFSPLASSTTEAWVLANTGSRPADRDAVDRRIVSEVKERKGRIIDTIAQVGGFPKFPSTYRAFNIPANPHADDNGNGYTNIEEILFQMAAQVEGK